MAVGMEKVIEPLAIQYTDIQDLGTMWEWPSNPIGDFQSRLSPDPCRHTWCIEVSYLESCRISSAHAARRKKSKIWKQTFVTHQSCVHAYLSCSILVPIDKANISVFITGNISWKSARPNMQMGEQYSGGMSVSKSILWSVFILDFELALLWRASIVNILRMPSVFAFSWIWMQSQE